MLLQTMKARFGFLPWLIGLACSLPSAELRLGFAQAPFEPTVLASMDAAINSAIDDNKLPGGVLWLERGTNRYAGAFGKRAVLPQPEAMADDTIFDAASLTKVLATTPAVMLLLERGKLELDQPVAALLPQFKDHGKEKITIRQLLTHTSGLRAGLSRRPDWSGYDKAIELACAEKLSSQPGTTFRYSDINFIVLAEVVRRISGSTLDKFSAKEIFQPLGMVDTCFLPAASKLSRIAPTEKSGRGILRGVVHDPTAQRMGGVAGHAGVFTTAADVARFSRMILNAGSIEGGQFLKPGTVRLMTSVQSPPEVHARRGLGWDIDSGYSRPRGERFPIGSFGHTGFTGVCLWIDPFSQAFWMFFSNRVHPDGSGNILELQRVLAGLAAEAITDFDFTNVPGALPARPAHSSP
jgi:CubicO group peptidase (beta-lactamase class C family)